MVEWHGLTKHLRGVYEEHADEEDAIKAVNMKFLQIFYLTAYEETDFYPQFEGRMGMMKEFLRALGVL